MDKKIMDRENPDRKKEEREKIRYIRKTQREYPEILRQYERMPAGLYVKGALPDPGKKTAALIGARNCSSYGRNQAYAFARRLAEEGVQVISGLAYGVDTWAHKGALDAGGATFAVLGCGVDICYPKENYIVYEEILKTGGGVLSEYEPGSPPLAWHFPIRNRIISGLADVILVVEARKKSGSLITADYGLEQGKSIYAVPGRVGDACSEGCNELIAQGAGIAWSPEVLLEELFGNQGRGSLSQEKMSECEERERKTEKLSEDEKKMLACLQATELSLETLAEESRMEPRIASSVLTMLTLNGFAVSRTPGHYCLAEDWSLF